MRRLYPLITAYERFFSAEYAVNTRLNLRNTSARACKPPRPPGPPSSPGHSGFSVVLAAPALTGQGTLRIVRPLQPGTATDVSTYSSATDRGSLGTARQPVLCHQGRGARRRGGRAGRP